MFVARTNRRRGSELVEGMLVIVPLMALVFLVIDASWAIFVKATIQYAVQAGVNYAAAGGTSPDGQRAGITQQVRKQASGLLDSRTITIKFFSPADMSTELTAGPGINAAGNVVQVQATYRFAPLAPLFRDGASIDFTASASNVLAVNGGAL